MYLVEGTRWLPIIMVTSLTFTLILMTSCTVSTGNQHIKYVQYNQKLQAKYYGSHVQLVDEDINKYPLPAESEHMRSLLEGGQRYCEARTPHTCCPGRDDKCFVPILETVCYCDEFCNRTVSDCCPDFWGHCLGVEPPYGAMTHPPQNVKPTPEYIFNNCKYGENVYAPGVAIHVNCNNCTCVKVENHPEFNWQCTQKVCIIRKELMDHLTEGNYGWKASNYSMFWGMTLEEGVTLKLGTKQPSNPVKQMTSLRVNIKDAIPLEFDAREQWPRLIHDIMDQGNCAASWAFSTASVASDRLSIHSGGSIKDTLSPQNLLSCNKDSWQKGCQGGHIDRAWWYLRRVGVVSSECYPYVSGVTGNTSPCHYPSWPTARAKCPHAKVDSSPVYQASPPYRIAPSEKEIMKEILENGPVQATMEVKEDFYMYSGGVYRYSLPADYHHPNHHKTGFHSVKIIGWGTDYAAGKPLKYWLCANSWGVKWGEDGYFRILRGVNECKIESFILGVWGKVNGHQTFHSGNVKQHKTHKTKHNHKHHQQHKMQHPLPGNITETV